MVRPPSSCHSPPGLGGLLGVVEVLGRRHLLWEGGTRQVGRWWGRSFPDSLYSIKYLEPVGVVGELHGQAELLLVQPAVLIRVSELPDLGRWGGAAEPPWTALSWGGGRRGGCCGPGGWSVLYPTCRPVSRPSTGPAPSNFSIHL